MFRSHWDDIEKGLKGMAGEIRNKIFSRVSDVSKDWGANVPRSPEEFSKKQEDFKKWGKDYIAQLKLKSESDQILNAKENFFVLLRNLGINDELLRETFVQNRKEVLDPVVGEMIAIVSLVLGWQKQDKEAFSQALGEIGVVGVFAAKPFICLIAICGLAWGYQKNFHKESFKKGGVLGLAGLTVAALSPGGFVGLLAAVVTMVYFNKKLSVDKPVETQLKEIFKQVRSGEFFKEVRGSWKRFEEFLSKLLNKSNDKDSATVVHLPEPSS